jgi:hypothetical protein
VVDASKHFTVGRLLYLVWYAPIGFVQRCTREGLLNVWLTALGRRKMQRAAAKLKSIPVMTRDPTPIYFLSGHRFWYQTVFCAYSLTHHAKRSFRLIVIDDGTLKPLHAEYLSRVFPGIQIRWIADVEKALDLHLPVARFPALRARRFAIPHLRKLTDVHPGSTGWKLSLDSDMLFYRRPDFLLNWMSSPQRPCYATDVDQNPYGYTVGLMVELVGEPIPPKVNIGICGLRSEALDWDRLESWCSTLLAREGSHYLQDQALVAMHLAGKACDIAPPDQYIVKPDRAETENPHATLHHYVAQSKAWYFRFGWKHFVQQ